MTREEAESFVLAQLEGGVLSSEVEAVFAATAERGLDAGLEAGASFLRNNMAGTAPEDRPHVLALADVFDRVRLAASERDRAALASKILEYVLYLAGRGPAPEPLPPLASA